MDIDVKFYKNTMYLIYLTVSQFRNSPLVGDR